MPERIIESAQSSACEPIAIIGMSCRYPGAGSLEAFWDLLKNGVDGVTEIPPERWDVDAFYDPDPAAPGKMNTRWGGFLDRIDQFDARFFNISPREANHMDPQQRMLLEVAWEALEQAGQTPDRLAGSQSGVFIATLGHDYDEYMFDDYSNIDAYIGTGNAHSVAANRLSYVFDLNGPSIAVDTACSGSLVAIHLASASLRSGESRMALAGGVNAILLPKFNIFFSKAGAMAPDGRCKTFDASANGIVRSEGVGIVVLKLLSQAIADGDPIHALVLGSAVNSDGRSTGLMAPNRQSQEILLREAYQKAGVSPGQIQYIEAHGTGTSLGDPIEIQALGSVLTEGRAEGRKCAIGSVKSNIGHTEAAAGVASVIKVALAMKHRLLPPTLHVKQPNPKIPFDSLPIAIQRAAGPWPVPEEPALAGVSAFGIGGTNAHIVLREAPPLPEQPTSATAGEAQLLTLSAKTPAALQDLARSYQQFLGADNTAQDLQHICYTASVRRPHHDHRMALVAQTREDAISQLTAFLNGDKRAGLSSGRRTWDTSKKLAFVFSGQGSHWLGMGRDLLAQEPVFRAALTEIDRLLSRHVDWSLLETLAAEPENSRLDETDVTQPAIFAVQVGLATLWHSWGIKPDAVVGHSLGEIAAAHIAGALSLEDAIQVVVYRSRLMKRVAGQGKTAVVALPFDQAQLMVAGNEDRLAIAGSNSPTSSVLSGDPGALERVLQFAERRNIFCRMLHGVDIAFHSPQMDPLKAELTAALAGITPGAATMPIYSTVTAKLHEGGQFDATYWGDNLREPFLFADAVQEMLKAGYTTFVEVSPHPVLVKSIQECAQHVQREVTVFASLRRNEAARNILLGTVGALYSQGQAVQWAQLYPAGLPCVTLPSYAWQRERFWYYKLARNMHGTPAEDQSTPAPRKLAGGHPLLGPVFQSALPQGQYFWEIDLSSDSPAYLTDHRVQGAVLVPGAAYIEMALKAAEHVFGAGSTTIEDIALKQAFFLPEEGSRTTQFVVTRETATTASFQILSRPSGDEQCHWTLHSSGKLRHEPETGTTTPATVSCSEIQARCFEEVSGTVHYHRMQAYLGLQYGPMFQAVEDIWRRDGEVLCKLKLPEVLEGNFNRYRIHPVLFDAAFQVVTATLPMHEGNATGDNTFLPVSMSRVQQHKPLDRELWCHVILRSEVSLKADSHTADIYLINKEGQIVAEVLGLLLHPLGGNQSAHGKDDIQSWIYDLAWQPQALPAAAQQQRRSWLIFTDRGGVGKRLQAALTARGDTCTTVAYGSGTHLGNGADFTIDPVSQTAFSSLLGTLKATGQPLTGGMIYLWGLDATAPENMTAATLEADHVLYCGSIIDLAQALSTAGLLALPRLWIMTRGAQTIADQRSARNIGQSSLWGLGRVIAREHPELNSVLVDLDSQPGAELSDVSLLIDELHNTNDEPHVAFCEGQRYIARMERRSSDAVQSLPLEWRADGSYLITGGLGGLGLAVARWMVEQGARRLILTGRTQIPPRAMWRQQQGESRIATLVAAIRELEALGASVHIASVDVTDEQGLTTFLQTYHSEGWPPIRGVVHAAGVLDDRLLMHMDHDALMKVLRPKVIGSWLLHHLLREQPLDFFVTFSSIAALLGSAGQSNYAAGNAFMDALAHYRRANGLPAHSINWGPWADVGMAAQPELTERLAAGGIGSFTPAQGIQAFGHVLRHDTAQTAILAADWSRWASEERAGLLSELLASSAQESDATSAIEKQAAFVHDVLLSVPAHERQAVLEKHLQGMVAGVLGLDPDRIDVQQPLNTLGLDSIMALELKNGIENSLGVSIALVAILQGPSTAEFASQIMPQLEEASAEMEKMLAELEDLSLEEAQTLLAETDVVLEGI
jgi:myxalamid-type polyketide synthase MxaE and MxaD